MAIEQEISELQARLAGTENAPLLDEVVVYVRGLEQRLDNAYAALEATLESGDVMREHVIENIQRGLRNEPQMQRVRGF
ncbi:hypothetical protein D3C87_703050 [compost metagenome]